MMQFISLSPLFGIETADIDLSQPLSDATFDKKDGKPTGLQYAD